MLRPATPLSVLLFGAFVLLLLSVISTPIISAIPLGSWEGIDFGVFGYCSSTGCTPIEIGYDVHSLHASDFTLSADTRSTLSSLLIVHPVAGALTLVMFVLAVVAHFHSPSHSPKYLLVLFIVGILNFLISLLSFLVDVLLFVPHIAWGSYLVLAATILVALSGLVACAMRRTVVGRKARQKRIAQNAEMSGENYYNRQAQESTAPVASSSGFSPTVPVVSGANGGADTLPEFASYDKRDDQSSDERIPLTAARSPSSRSHGRFNSDQTTYANDASNPVDGVALRSMSTTPGTRDQYGNPLPAQDGYPMRTGSIERIGSPARGPVPPGGYRGRGGYPGPGRGGGYGGYGAQPGGRGGYGPPGRGGYGSPGGRGGYGAPPRGYGGGSMRGGRTPPPPSYQGPQGSYDRRGPPVGPYGAGQHGAGLSPGPSSASGGYQSVSNLSSSGYEAYTPSREELPRAESPPPLPGIDDSVDPPRAVEMDASANRPTGGQGPTGQYHIRDSDSDVAGMLALQQARTSEADRHMSGSSKYSQEDNYVPPRQGWTQGLSGNSPRVPSPLNTRRPPQQSAAPPAGEYYEDVDPRFAEPSSSAQVPVQKPATAALSTATNAYEDVPPPQGSLSPAASERSTFTSISQRSVNPRWNPAAPPPLPHAGRAPPPPTTAAAAAARTAVPRRPVPAAAAAAPNPTDILLDSNPDFGLPGRGGASRS